MIVVLNDLENALASNEVVPCFQPLVELRTGRLAGFEVLARWQHPQYGLVLPQNFISLAEENALMKPLMSQVFSKAFKSAPVLPEPLKLSVNISPVQFHDLSLPKQIRELAEVAGFPLERLMVEITESALLDNLNEVRQIAAELKTMGCKLSLDDFGTGYSSLRHLQALRFDELKVDGSFIASMSSTRDSRKIVAAVIGLGLSLGMTTVAEGVETEEQASMLLWLGCDIGQGWLYGRPVTADKIPDLVAALPRAVSSGMAQPSNGEGMNGLEAQPAQRLAQLQAIYDGAPVGLCFMDRNLRYVSLNRRYADLNGGTVEAYIGKTMQEMVPEVFQRVERIMPGVLQGEVIADKEISRPSTKPGEPDLRTLVTYQPAFDEAGEVIGISVSVVDITERKHAEDALRASEDHYRHMVELNPQMPWVMDAEGNNLDISARWVQMTGLTKQQTHRLGWLDALHPDDVKPTMTALREGLRTGKPIDVEYRVWSTDGGWRWMRSRGAPRYGPSGEVTRWYGSLENIDERKQMLEVLRKSRT
jgi:PAS domain S-box-containing protein